MTWPDFEELGFALSTFPYSKQQVIYYCAKIKIQ